MGKKILCIVRASTERQETESQKKELIEYCITKGFSLEEIDYIEVAGASARKLNKKYIQMLEDIKATLLTSPTIKAVALWD
ncbi:recombinase family protein [Prevotella sp.]|uniref:recombinase family protein n=1 Tax=Prevotella sp. TaxID=59823 RepID=UPI0030776FD1